VPAGPIVYKRILCPVDFSESSLNALKYATSLAQEADGQLTVLHVVAHEFEYPPGPEYAGVTVGDLLKAREEGLERQLREIVAAEPEFCRIDSLMTHGKPWREVLRVAQAQRSDLIVMGVQGRAAADLLVFGSTAQHVVRAASCPVLTLRQA
jgi:nucleotide-binding universal stress UspA family protein